MLTPSAVPFAGGGAADGAPRPAPPHPGLGLYLREVHRQPPLSTDEEERLLARSRQGDRSAHATLLRRSLRLVPAIAQHYLGRGANLLDLIEHGNAGLLRAVEAYDPHDGPFCVLAAKQIARAIEAFLRRCGGASPPTRQIISGAQ